MHFFLGNNHATSSLLLWFTVELDSITQIHRLQINDSWICLNKKQVTDEYFLVLLYCMWQFFQGFYLLSSYICLFYSQWDAPLAFDQVWSITNMHCGDLTYLHMNGTTFRSIVNCTLCFLCSLLPVRISLIRHILRAPLQFLFWITNSFCEMS